MTHPLVARWHEYRQASRRSTLVCYSIALASIFSGESRITGAFYDRAGGDLTRLKSRRRADMTFEHKGRAYTVDRVFNFNGEIRVECHYSDQGQRIGRTWRFAALELPRLRDPDSTDDLIAAALAHNRHAPRS